MCRRIGGRSLHVREEVGSLTDGPVEARRFPVVIVASIVVIMNLRSNRAPRTRPLFAQNLTPRGQPEIRGHGQARARLRDRRVVRSVPVLQTRG